MKGKLIVIEGLDGSGKATQTLLLHKMLSDKGYDVNHISFPNYDEPSSALVKMYLNSEFGNDPSDVNAYAASSFFAVDRYASYMRLWKNKYESNEIILCDRYVTSNAIYQMAKMNENLWEEYLKWLYDYEYNKLGLPRANCIIYLYVPVDISQKLMDDRYIGDVNKKDLHERNIDFLKSCQKAAEYVSGKDEWEVIDCSYKLQMKSEIQIHNTMVKILKDKGYISESDKI